MAQRLVRTCCPHCRDEATAGCGDCGGSGYSGRMALFEWLPVGQVVRAQILAGASAEELEKAAVGQGMRTLKQAGDAAVTRRLTTDAEVLRVLGTNDV